MPAEKSCEVCEVGENANRDAKINNMKRRNDSASSFLWGRFDSKRRTRWTRRRHF